ncbi:aromatic ring-opening dioxygenase LigA [Intrasporangium calvum]|uniref:Aromatic ring-opening dioxygenase LigA n=1 Tax=Intrasporangium calvum TaxID=53358 RepID=A0ABT5GFG9_9MICO|nr:aromatic ring-opening dioxygenase LigA [Intrasporangium calvum]MDC5696858.1 aromatic ring-opening dioxygenase LigA [Intrasporangium calvum]
MASRTARTLGTIVAIVGILMIVAGGVTYYMVHTELKAAKITVAKDATMLAGDKVDGPFSAYAQAQIIDKHALDATGGKTYAELDREDPLRQTAMSASFLRASLFTSVVAFGVAAMAMGLGLMLLLIGWALVSLSRRDVVHDRAPDRTV